MNGLQWAFVVGLTHQIIAYAILMLNCDWQLASDESKKRQLESSLVKKGDDYEEQSDLGENKMKIDIEGDEAVN